MSRHMLLFATILVPTVFGVSHGQISPAAQTLETCDVIGLTQGQNAVAQIQDLSVCVVGIGTIMQLTHDTGALFNLKKAVDSVMEQGADKFDTCSLFTSGDSPQNVINVQGYDSIVTSIVLTTTVQIPISTIATKIQRTDDPNTKVTFLYQNSYLYPTGTIGVYKLDTAVTFEVCPIPGSYDLTINVRTLTDCIVAFKLNVKVGPQYPYICPLGFPLPSVF